jgi:hypothetical protein
MLFLGKIFSWCAASLLLFSPLPGFLFKNILISNPEKCVNSKYQKSVELGCVREREGAGGQSHKKYIVSQVVGFVEKSVWPYLGRGREGGFYSTLPFRT